MAYAFVLAAATAFGRIGGWLNWGATLRSFGRAITNGYDHLIGLSHAWHTDRPSGEVIATLETSTWAFVELIDAMVWGILRISVTTLGAIVVLGIVAWPVALVMAALVAVFVARAAPPHGHGSSPRRRTSRMRTRGPPGSSPTPSPT